MTPDETTELLAYASAKDPRASRADELDYLSVAAVWTDDLAPVPRYFGQDYVRRYYQSEEPRQQAITSGMIRAGWERGEQDRADHAYELARVNRDVERHCRQRGCPCTHADPCFAGWITVEERYPLSWVDSAPDAEPTHGVGYRCPTCANYINQRLILDGKDPLPPFPPPPDHVWHAPPEDNDPADVDPDLRDAVLGMMRDAVKRP